MQLSKLEAALNNYLNNGERKLTHQRRAILAVFVNADAHVTVEDLYIMTQQQYPNIGIATVYRTVKLLCECGLASGFKHSDGAFRYELEKEHHNHLMCIKCGRLIEDTDAEVEVLQNKLARKNKFKILHTRIEAYGICHTCLKSDHKDSRGRFRRVSI
ncbi:MAG: ferric uptake regulator family protein [Firmicutes bacterium]|nr:ferric uptake regulator family protein [Bacillota bacterium]